MTLGRPRLVPILLFIVLAWVSWEFREGRIAHREQILGSYTEAVADQACIRLVDYVQSRLASLAVLAGSAAQRLRTGDVGGQRAGFGILARGIYRTQPGFQAISWLDSTGVFRIVVPEEKNPRVRGFDVRQHPEPSARAAFARAERETTATVTGCVTLLQGGEGFSTYIPVVVDGKLRGVVNGVFRVSDSVHAALDTGVLDEFHLVLREGSRLVFDERDLAEEGDRRLAVRRRLDLPNGPSWTMELTPRAALVKQHAATWVDLFLALNLIVSGLIAIMVGEFMRRARALRAAHERALAELAGRQSAEREKERTIRDLEQANRRLEEGNEELDAYIYAASHDVRAPLVAVGGLVDVLLDEETAPSAEERQLIIARIRHNIQKLDTLVQDMLAVSRSRRLERTSAPIDIRRLCEEVWGGLKDLGSDQPLAFSCEIMPDRPFSSDPLRFRQIVNNLLSNALKYRDPGKPLLEVRVTGRIAETPDGPARLELTVRDNGLGIDEKSIPRVFDMFYKASHESFGSGLGLYIVKQHVQALGGEVVCRTLPGGTEFTVTLPEDRAA